VEVALISVWFSQNICAAMYSAVAVWVISLDSEYMALPIARERYESMNCALER
jgi:hypothetical protein